MAKTEVPLHQLNSFIPNDCLSDVLFYIEKYKIHLTVTRKRETILGDYKHAYNQKTHRISVNGNLNQFSFLITLLHEIAHLLTFEKYGHTVNPHGMEWKKIFSEILQKFIDKKIFPSIIEDALKNTLKNPAASSCEDTNLLRVLRTFDAPTENSIAVENLDEGNPFKIKDGRLFQKGPKIRKRYLCKEVSTGKIYLFNGLYEVIIV